MAWWLWHVSGQHGHTYFGGAKAKLCWERFLELEELRGWLKKG